MFVRIDLYTPTWLMIIQETDEEWSIKVRAKKFRAYNAQWLLAVEEVCY